MVKKIRTCFEWTTRVSKIIKTKHWRICIPGVLEKTTRICNEMLKIEIMIFGYFILLALLNIV